MSILPFKKQKEDINLELIDELRYIRTRKKQLLIQEKELIKKMNENVSTDNYLYDMENNPIAKLTISTRNSFDSEKFKESYADVYSEYTKLVTTRRWGLL